MLDFITRQTAWYTDRAKQLELSRGIIRFHNVGIFAHNIYTYFGFVTFADTFKPHFDKCEELMVRYFKHKNKTLKK